ncbi:MAG TPA: phospholipid carrier-dependent glycosyltransferase [Usitatibacter sp.]|jgi:4-amino-4-deoxy-L-arabinose transferase-like glycosyltransferase|nr:phospholipid carrier-dependent glycosyltransferase [Usitatibacter sp.]
MSRHATRIILLLLAVAALAIGVDGLQRRLANPDEGRYSEIAREMALSGDWVTPRLDGIKYFEKPPLQYWATAAVFRAFGEGEATARLYVAACGLLTILVAAYASRRLGSPATRLGTVLALFASPYFMALGTIVTLDMGVTLWITAALCAFVLAEQAAERGSRSAARWIAAAWAAMALAVLSKGLIGIVFVAAAVFFHIVLRRDFSVLKRLGWGYGIPIFLALAAPWFVMVSLRNPGFAHFFFIHEHFQRFLTHEARRVEPWWFFLPIVAFGFLPWSFAMPAAIAHAWRGEAGARFQPLRVALAWCAFVVLFFSASGSKLPTYVLPVFPVLGIVLGRYLADAPPRRLGLWAALGAALAIPLAAAAFSMDRRPHDAWTAQMYAAARPWAIAAVAAYLAGVLCGAGLLRAGRRWVGVAAIALGSLLVIECIENAYEELTPRQSGWEVAQAMRPYLAPATRLYSVNHYEQTVPFYIRRTMTLVDYRDEFETGLAAEPWKAIPDLASFPAEWLRPGEAMAIMQPGTYEKFRAQGLPMQVLHEDPRRVLVRKP